MSLIDTDYFVLDINLPTDDDFSVLDDYIEKYEPEILKKVLGYTLYKAMTADPTNEPYKSLIEGKEYTVEYNGVTHYVKWNGLKNSEKISLIAYYVYYYWQRAHASFTAWVGEIKPDSENASPTSTAIKVSKAWLEMRKLIGGPGQDQLEPSLYNYLLKNETDFPEWIFNPPGSVNSFDL